MQMCMLLYYWANKMMMMMMICTRWLAAVIFTFSSLIIITALYCVFFSIFDFVCHMLHGYYCNRVHEERQTYSQITLHTQQYAVSVAVCDGVSVWYRCRSYCRRMRSTPYTSLYVKTDRHTHTLTAEMWIYSDTIFEPAPENWRRPPGRPRTTWMKNIHDHLGILGYMRPEIWRKIGLSAVGHICCSL